MKKELVSILRTFNFPVYQQGSLNDTDIYPTAFFTYWNTQTEDLSFYDDLNHRCVWMFTVYFYCTNEELTNTILLEAKQKLLDAGWEVEGKGYDVPSDEKTHTGRAIDVLYIEQEDYNEHSSSENL